jgi:hypothetical protein
MLDGFFYPFAAMERFFGSFRLWLFLGFLIINALYSIKINIETDFLNSERSYYFLPRVSRWHVVWRRAKRCDVFTMLFFAAYVGAVLILISVLGGW